MRSRQYDSVLFFCALLEALLHAFTKRNVVNCYQTTQRGRTVRTTLCAWDMAWQEASSIQISLCWKNSQPLNFKSLYFRSTPNTYIVSFWVLPSFFHLFPFPVESPLLSLHACMCACMRRDPPVVNIPDAVLKRPLALLMLLHGRPGGNPHM
jgi:hypothetical protein